MDRFTCFDLTCIRAHLVRLSDLLPHDAGNSLHALNNPFAVAKHAKISKRMEQLIVPEFIELRISINSTNSINPTNWQLCVLCMLCGEMSFWFRLVRVRINKPE